MSEQPTAHPTPGPGILFIQSSVRWNFLWQRHQSIAAAAAADGWSVIFAEPHPRALRQVALVIRRKLSGQSLGGTINPVAPNVRVVSWRPGYRSALSVRRILAEKRHQQLLLLAYVPSRSLIRLIAKLRPDAIVYDRVLDWAAVPRNWYPPRSWRKVERKIFARAQGGSAVVTSDSPWTTNSLQRSGTPAKLLLPAVDDAFDEYEWSPPESSDPWGYFGTVRESEIDVDALVTASHAHGLVVVGEVPTEIAERLTAAGARVLPAMPPAELVRVVDRWSVVMLPYRPSPRTATLVPAKLWNALATGRPVVVQNLSIPDEVSFLVESSDVTAPGGVALAARDLANWQSRWQQLKRWALADGGIHGSH